MGDWTKPTGPIPKPWNLSPAWIAPEFQPLWKGLVGGYVPGFGDLSPRAPRGRGPATHDGTITIAEPTRYGPIDWPVDDPANHIKVHNPFSDGTIDLHTILFYGRPMGTDTWRTGIFYHLAGDYGAYSWGSGGGQMAITWFEAGAMKRAYFSPLVLPDDDSWQMIVTQRIATSGSQFRIYVNGGEHDVLKGGETGNNPDGTAPMGSYFEIGGATNYWDAEVACGALYCWDRVLTDSEIEVAINDPWGMVRPYWESRAPIVRAAGGAALVQVVGETVQASEGLVAPMSLNRLQAETVELSEGSVRSLSLSRLLGETVQVSDSSVRSMAMNRVADETVEVSEGSVVAQALVRIANATVEYAEGVLRALGITAQADETIEVSESSSTVLGIVAVVSATIEVAESFAQTIGLTRLIGETAQVSESTVTSRAQVRQQAESVELSESPLPVRALVRLVAETVNIVESNVITRAIVRVLGESVQVAEGIVTKLADVVIQVLTGALQIRAALSGSPQVRGALSAANRIRAALSGSVRVRPSDDE